MNDFHRIEHASIGVPDIELATEFYTTALGLIEVADEDDTVYLGCGRDTNYDLALIEGDTGIEHFAVRATHPDVVDEYERRLKTNGFPVDRADTQEPNQAAGIRFELPSGVPMEIVTVTDDDYQHYEDSLPTRRGHAPADVDHIQFLTPTVMDDLEFLYSVLDFTISEIAGPRDDPEIAFARCNTFHHDIALKSAQHLGETDTTSLHHVAFSFDSIDHLTTCIDSVVRAGCSIERGIGRHRGGNNIFAYFWTPGGNRIELCTQMATVSKAEPAHVEDYEQATTAWGPPAPDTFKDGSGLITPK